MIQRNKKAPLTFSEYQRMHNVVHTLAKHWTKDSGRACVFFSIVGAALMHGHYGKNAKVVCGNGAVMLDQRTELTLSWFEHKDGFISTGAGAFHTWIVCDGWIVDLMAPNYRESMVGATHFGQDGNGEQRAPAFVAPRLMLQRPLDRTDGSLEDIRRTGDCVFMPNPDLTASTIGTELNRPVLGDIVEIALAWHRPLPEKMESAFTVADDLGEITTIQLIKRDLTGAW